eukprot:Sspe_Gene.117847::Locus_109872_Transcript_1_1_Confidence_1.000_Length_961::g.117847::m.117847
MPRFLLLLAIMWVLGACGVEDRCEGVVAQTSPLRFGGREIERSLCWCTAGFVQYVLTGEVLPTHNSTVPTGHPLEYSGKDAVQAWWSEVEHAATPTLWWMWISAQKPTNLNHNILVEGCGRCAHPYIRLHMSNGGYFTLEAFLQYHAEGSYYLDPSKLLRDSMTLATPGKHTLPHFKRTFLAGFEAMNSALVSSPPDVATANKYGEALFGFAPSVMGPMWGYAEGLVLLVHRTELPPGHSCTRGWEREVKDFIDANLTSSIDQCYVFYGNWSRVIA